MSTPAIVIDSDQIGHWLSAARHVIATVQTCWLATRAEAGGAHARAVRIHPAPGGDEWTRRFVCRRGSRKVAELRADPRVTLAYQTSTGDAYVALGGQAELVEDRTEMRSLWSAAADAFFPAGFADANMIVARVAVDCIEVHARGVTAEPFGHGRTLIQRDHSGSWRYVPF